MQKNSPETNDSPVASNRGASTNALQLLWFSAQWCGPCQQMAPTYSAINESYGGVIDIKKIDVDEYPELANDYQVRGVPSLVLINGNSVFDRQVGALPLAALDDWLKKAVNTHNVT